MATPEILKTLKAMNFSTIEIGYYFITVYKVFEGD